MLLSVVIPARNAEEHLPVQLGGLAAQTYTGDWELIVADNGSTDRTRDVVEAARSGLPHLQVVDASARPGSNPARNAGARAARGEFVLFLDHDDEVAPAWLAAMADAANDAQAVGGAIDRTRFRPPGVPPPVPDRTTELQPWPGFLSYPMGANCGIRADRFHELGGFDESYTRGGDETELFWRLQLAGHEVRFVTDAVVFYRERTTMADLWRQFFHYGKQDPHLFRDFRSAGMPAHGIGAGLREWGHLTALAPRYLSTAAGRRQWVRSTARRAGRVAGSVQYRVCYC
jgi:GT2 family glycosyltransferase